MTTTDIEDFTISRTFDAPRERVWRANTEIERMKQWWSPKGFTTAQAQLDLRPGGVYHYCLVSPDGLEMWGKLTYREIVPQEKIVCVVSFSDRDGGMTRHPMSPTWPREMLSTATFADAGDGRTELTVRWRPLNAAPEEIATFDQGRDDMRQGFSGTFDNLAAHLAQT